MLLLALFLQQAPVYPTIVPVPSIPVVSLPEEPKPQFLRDLPSRLTFVLSTRKLNKVGRIYAGGVSFEVSPRLNFSGGYELQGWTAGVAVRPFPKKK